jgi:hypothetical protein
MILGAFMGQFDHVRTRLHNQYKHALYLDEAPKRRHKFSTALKEMRQGGSYLLLSLLLPGFFAGLLYLWRHDNQMAALWLQLPVLLMLVGMCLTLLWRKKKKRPDL